jgi:hypothetical protein
MTVAIGTEMEPGGQIAPAQGQAVASTPGKAFGAEGFRSSWQSFLASLGEGMAGNAKQGAVTGEADATAATVGKKDGDLAGGSSSGARSNPRATPAAGQERKASADHAIKSFEGAHAGISTRRANDAIGWQVPVNPGDRELTAGSAANDEYAAASSDRFESGSANRSAKSVRREANEETTAAKKPAAEALSATLSIAAPETVTLAARMVPVPISAAELSAPAPAVSTPVLLGDSPRGSSHSGSVGGLTNQARGNFTNSAAKEVAPAANASPVLGRGALTNGPRGAQDENLEPGDRPASSRVEADSGEGNGLLEGARGQAGERSQASDPLVNQTRAQPSGTGLPDTVAPLAGDGPSARPNAELDAGLAAGTAADFSSAGNLASAGRSIAAGDRGVVEQAALRATRGLAPVEAGQAAGHNAPTSDSADASSPVRDPAVIQGATYGVREAPVGSTGGATASASETFAALDAGTGGGKTSWIHAGKQSAEAGFEDPALGWVSVRADLGAGGIHAAVVPGSAEAAQALGGHMAGLNEWLAERHTPVQSLTMTAPQGAGADSDASRGMRQGTQQGGGQNAEQGSYPGPQPESQPNVAPISATAPREANGGRPRETGLQSGPTGLHISVMA